jgi:phosphatidylserine decarboxylase
MTTFYLALQALLPQHLISRAIGWLALVEKPLWLKNALIQMFVAAYGIDLSEAEGPRAEEYPHFNAFFTRALVAGARPMADSEWLQVADGVVSELGQVDGDLLLQAKGRYYTAQALLAGSAEEAAAYHNGSFMTVYLSPRDYHRVHMPIAGRLVKTRYVPGDLFAVNLKTAAGVDQLYARNERLVCFFETEQGPLAMVLVGAIIVAGIETVWGGVEAPDPSGVREVNFSSAQAPSFAAGDEIGRFFLGSTVVLLTPQTLSWQIEPGTAVKVRGALAGTALSGSETALSGSETALSGVETALSGSETALSGSETALSGVETALSETAIDNNDSASSETI